MGGFHKLERALERVHLGVWLVGLFVPAGWVTMLSTASVTVLTALALGVGELLPLLMILTSGLLAGLLGYAGWMAWWRRGPEPAAQPARVSEPPNPAVHEHYMTAKAAIHYIAQDAGWGAHKEMERTPDGLSKNPLLEAPEEFRQRAAEGKIRSYGRSPETHQHELIPKEHWMSFGLDYLALFREDDNGGRTEMKDALGGYYRNKGYTDLRIVTEDVYATWPKRKAT